MAVLIFTAACGGDSTVPSSGIAGTYTLRTVNGSVLPYTISQTGPSKVEVIDDAIALSDNGSWTESGHRRNTVGTLVTTSTTADAGSFTKTGPAITMSSATSGALTGTLVNGTLSLVSQGAVFVYMQ